MKDKMTIKLDHPVEYMGVTYKELTMRRYMKVRDQIAAGHLQGINPPLFEATVAANMCEVPPEVIEELYTSDYAKVSKALTASQSAPVLSPNGSGS